ncbi:MAG: hypothetical protein WCG20_04115 [bacterium]
MKQLLKNIFIFGTLGLAIAIVATQVYAAPFVPTNNTNPEPLKFLNVSSTNQSKQGWLGLGSAGTYNPLAVLDVKNTTFADALSVIGKAWFSGNLLVGYTSIPSVITNKLMVDQGYIRSTTLTGTGDRPACTNATGKFIPCTNNGVAATPQTVSTSPLCGAAANTFQTVAPSQLGDLCNTATQQNAMPIGSVNTGPNGTFTWTCYNWQVSGYVSATCSTSPLPPTCGATAYIATVGTPATADRCLSGTASSLSTGANGVYTWTCTDTYGNPPATCSTPPTNIVPTQPTGCFAMRSVLQGGVYPAVLTCAQGSANATRYELQNLSDNGTTWVSTMSDGYTNQQISSVPAIDAKPTASGLGSWTRALSQILPQAIIINEWKDGQGNANPFYAGDYSQSILWRVRGCNTAGCGSFSEPIAPFSFYNPGADNIHGYYDGNGSDYTFYVQKTFDTNTNKLTFTWKKLPNAALNSLYPTVYIHQCSQSGCTGPLVPGYANHVEYVDPLTLAGTNGTEIPHGPITCTSGTNAMCSTIVSPNTANPGGYPLNADYMITLGKDLYNDARPGPTQSAINNSLSGYFSAWDQFSPWTVAQIQ